jgi:hypothetical protein
MIFPAMKREVHRHGESSFFYSRAQVATRTIAAHLGKAQQNELMVTEDDLDVLRQTPFSMILVIRSASILAAQYNMLVYL